MTEVITFGCRLNAYESEVMQRHAEAAGLDDAIIVNTCSVTAEAERQARQAIRRLRRANPNARLIVTGCAAHIDPAKFRAMPEVDAILANDRKTEAESFRHLFEIQLKDVPSVARHESPRQRQNGDLQRAFVEVQNGCDHDCTFCIIPSGRGASRSVPMGALADHMRRLVAQGYNELVFTGVDIASYGGDLPGQPSLGQMTRRVLAAVPELRRLRLSSLDPAAMDEDLWQLIAEEPRLMPHIHLSLQAGDDMILKRMKRRHRRADVVTLCDRARRLRPDIAFGADIIAGFPTETDAMFQNTADLVAQCDVTWLHVFPYSARTGTPAAKMPQVNGTLRRERAERLRALGEQAVERHMRGLVGKKIEVLVEQQGVGCTPQFAKVGIPPDADVGRVATVTCIKVDGVNAVCR